MKKLQLVIPAFLLVLSIIACRTGQHTIVSSNDNGKETKLEFWGNVYLNDTRSAIKSISKDGYVEYKKNGDDLHITYDNNGVFHYEFNGTKTDRLDGTAQALLTEAVHKIAELPGH